MNAIYLDKDWNPVPQDQAALVKVRMDDGRIVFGVPAGDEKKFHGDHDQSDHGNWVDDIDLSATKVPEEDRFPPSSEDPAPGGKYQYHAKKAQFIKGIAKQGIKGGRSNPISVAPHLESARWWGASIDVGGGDTYLMRVSRDALRKEGLRTIKPDDDAGNPISDSEETREHWVTGTILPGVIEIYFKGRWQKIRDAIKDEKQFHLPGEHDQLDHGNWAKGGGEGPLSQLPDEQRQKFLELEAKFARNHKHENAAFAWSDDFDVTTVKGQETQVQLSDDLIERIRDDGDVIMTHNHPVIAGDREQDSVTGLSDEDIFSASGLNLKAIRAVTEFEGKQYVFSLERPKKGWPSVVELEAFRYAEEEEEEDRDFEGPFWDETPIGKLINHYRRAWGRADKENDVKKKRRLELAVSHAITKMYAKRFGMNYKMVSVRV